MSAHKKDWRGLPITAKQIALIEQMGIPFDYNMTRGEASDAIWDELENSPHIFPEEAVQG